LLFRMIVAALTMARLPWGCCQQLNKAPSSRYLARTDFARFRKEIGKRRHERREGVGECVAVALPGLTVTVAVPGMSPRPIRYSKVWPYVEDTKSRSKVSESEEDLANSGYASPSCFSLCWFAWKADCSASVRQYLWSGRRVAGFWLRQRQTGIHILFATLQIQPDMIEVRSFGSISYILGSV